MMQRSELEALGRAVWGDINRTMTTRDEIRFGKNGSKSIDAGKCTWFDHEANRGGGCIELRDMAHGSRPAGGGIIATYDYHALDGRLAYQVVRKVPKTFLQRRPDSAGGWKWDMKGQERYPYRLPAILAADPTAPIFIVEGEKDVDALDELVLPATTNPGGAGKWPASFGPYFAGRRVVILPDNDDVGEKHALDVAEKLARHAAEIRIVRLPDLPPKGDVSDWLAAGGTADELEALAAAASLWRPGAEPLASPADAALRDFLCVQAWARRDLPAPDKLLGDLITTTTRIFLVGTTGLGKTMFGFAWAKGMADGTGFLHWRATRPARVLYIDGEMAAELIKIRSLDVIRRAPGQSPTGMLAIYSRDFDEQTATAFPQLGQMPPLNTTEGHEFIYRLIEALGGVDVIFFDNVMSLLTGNMKDEEAWAATMPLISELSARRIGQVWLDHTGHDTSRQYGTNTKAWRFDAVGVMTPLPKTDQREGELAFQLSFDPPGKARRRTPDNRSDFETCIVRLADDQWTGDRPEGGRAIKAKVSPVAQALHGALLDALVRTDTPGSTTRDNWYAEAVRLGLLDAHTDIDTPKTRDAKRARLRKYITELRAAGWVGVDGETVRNLRNGG
jgi:hypothetical protein